MIIEVVGYKGIVGNATYRWFTAMTSLKIAVYGRDKGNSLLPPTIQPIISFICVPEAHIDEVCSEAANYASLVIIRSTVPPGTCQRLQGKLGIHICHNPEFLREATSVQDIFNPSYILIGACCQEHGALLQELYSPAQAEIVVTDPLTSEFTKIITNNYLACLISFWNEMEAICRASGSSAYKIAAIATKDPRVTEYGARWHHKFAGKCLPKEIEQMADYAAHRGVKVPMLKAIKEVNECQIS